MGTPCWVFAPSCADQPLPDCPNWPAQPPPTGLHPFVPPVSINNTDPYYDTTPKVCWEMLEMRREGVKDGSIKTITATAATTLVEGWASTAEKTFNLFISGRSTEGIAAFPSAKQYNKSKFYQHLINLALSWPQTLGFTHPKWLKLADTPCAANVLWCFHFKAFMDIECSVWLMGSNARRVGWHVPWVVAFQHMGCLPRAVHACTLPAKEHSYMGSWTSYACSMTPCKFVHKRTCHLKAWLRSGCHSHVY